MTLACETPIDSSARGFSHDTASGSSRARKATIKPPPPRTARDTSIALHHHGDGLDGQRHDRPGGDRACPGHRRPDDARCHGPIASRQDRDAGSFQRVRPFPIPTDPSRAGPMWPRSRRGAMAGKVRDGLDERDPGGRRDRLDRHHDPGHQVRHRQCRHGLADDGDGLRCGLRRGQRHRSDWIGLQVRRSCSAPGASASAAASEAAYTVLSALDPDMEPLLEVRMAQSLAAVPSASASAAGVAVGREVAQDMLAWRDERRVVGDRPLCRRHSPGPVAAHLADIPGRLGARVGPGRDVRDHETGVRLHRAAASRPEQPRICRRAQSGRVARGPEQHHPHARRDPDRELLVV